MAVDNKTKKELLNTITELNNAINIYEESDIRHRDERRSIAKECDRLVRENKLIIKHNETLKSITTIIEEKLFKKYEERLEQGLDQLRQAIEHEGNIIMNDIEYKLEPFVQVSSKYSEETYRLLTKKKTFLQRLKYLFTNNI